MVELARARHPELTFEHAAGEDFAVDESFDYIVLSDLVPYVDDLLAVFRNAAAHATPETRIVVHSYSQLWRPALALLERLGLKSRTPIRNWLTIEDVTNLLQLTGLEPVTRSRRILLPLQIPLLSAFLNGVLAGVWVHPAPLPDLVDRRPTATAGGAAGAERLDRRAGQERGRDDRADRRRDAAARPRERADLRRGPLDRRDARGDPAARSSCTPSGRSSTSSRREPARATPSGSDSSGPGTTR